METNDIKQKIQDLESQEGYFSIIQSLSICENIPFCEAWKQVEKTREELGLNPKYRSAKSFYSARERYHLCGGTIYRFQGEE